jgi:hypothetical protein
MGELAKECKFRMFSRCKNRAHRKIPCGLLRQKSSILVMRKVEKFQIVAVGNIFT